MESSSGSTVPVRIGQLSELDQDRPGSISVQKMSRKIDQKATKNKTHRYPVEITARYDDDNDNPFTYRCGRPVDAMTAFRRYASRDLFTSIAMGNSGQPRDFRWPSEKVALSREERLESELSGVARSERTFRIYALDSDGSLSRDQALGTYTSVREAHSFLFNDRHTCSRALDYLRNSMSNSRLADFRDTLATFHIAHWYMYHPA